MQRLLSLLACLLLASCAGYGLVQPGKFEIDNKIAVVTGTSWSWKAEEGLIHWTRDGPALERLIFHAVDDGKALYPTIDNKAKQHILDTLAGTEHDTVSLVFRKTMSEGELMDLVAGSLERAELRHVKPLNFGPAPFAGHQGFRMEYEGIGRHDEVRRKGLATGAVVDGRLYLVNYVGTLIYHYDRTLPEVQKIIDSATIVAKKG